MIVSARKRDGAPAELSAADLEIKVDGKVVTVQDVHRLDRPPLRYCLLFDSSGSQRRRFKQQQDTATELLSRITRKGQDYGALVAFNNEFYLDAEGSDPDQLVRAVGKERAVGGTAIYDAAARCANHLVKAAPGGGVRVMFILSDGEDNASNVSQDATASALVRAGVRAYGLGGTGGQRAITAVKHLTEDSGGKVYVIWKEQDLEAALTDLAGELSSLFAITASPAVVLPGGRSYKLEIRTFKKDVSLAGPHQYYIPKQ